MVSREQVLLLQSGLFDADWYVARYPDTRLVALTPLEHFLRFGWRLGRCPGPCFDPDDYLRRYPDVAAADIDPLRHYLLFGSQEGRQAAGAGGQAADANPLHRISRSGLFDPQWYRDEYQDVAESGIDPLEHYVLHGGRERRDPGPRFDTAHYLQQCPEARRCEVPLLHYLQHGKGRGFSPLPRLSRQPWWAELSHTVQPFSSDTLQRLRAAALTPLVILPVLAPAPSLRACLEALSRHTCSPCRIVVVNDCRDPVVGQVMEACAARSPFECVTPEKPLGWDGCIELARRLAKTADYVLLSPDTLVSPGWLSRLRVAACQREDIASMSACIETCPAWHDGAAVARHGRFAAQSSAGQSQPLQAPDLRCCYVRADADVAALHWRDGSVWVASAAPAPMAMPLPASPVKPRALYVLSTRTGGTPQTNQDLMSALESEWECFVLRCNTRVLSLLHFAEGVYTEVQRHRLSAPLMPFPHCSEEYDRVVAGWLHHYAVELVHVRHLAWHGLGLLNTVHAMGLPLVVSFHDFYTLCPSVKLLDEQQRFCAGQCTPGEGVCGQELWPSASMPPLKHSAVHQWQQMFRQALRLSDAFVTTTPSARRYITSRYPELAERPFEVIPHGRDFTDMQRLAVAPSPETPLKIVFPGYLTQAKGGQIIAELAHLVSAQTVEIHILGEVAEGVCLPASVVRHGRYTRDEFVERIRAIDPHVGGVLSIWPETFCHTLTELWSCGLPVIGFDLGAVGDRIKATGGGWVTPTLSAQGILPLLDHARETEAWQKAQRQVARWQQEARTSQRCVDMARAYATLYASVGQQRFAVLNHRQEIPVVRMS